jgi:hypothetical protein
MKICIQTRFLSHYVSFFFLTLPDRYFGAVFFFVFFLRCEGVVVCDCFLLGRS